MSISVTLKRNAIEEPLKLNAEGCDNAIGSAKTADGRVFPAQKCGNDVVILADGARNEALELELSADSCGAGVKIVEAPQRNALDIYIGGDLFTSYVYSGQLKPYLGPILAKNGDWITRLDLETKEHPHQRSVFVAVGDVNGIDFWNENSHPGEERHQGFDQIVSGNAFGTFTARNVWLSETGVPQLDEKRTYTFYAQSPACRYVDLAVTFTATYGDVVFGPTKEAGPLGIRINESMRADRGGHFCNAYGAENEAEAWGRPAPWCDYRGEVNGNAYGIAAFDNEDNERYPTTWHIRNYGLFAANSLYFKGGLTIRAGESLTYKIRLCFYEGEIDTAARFQLYAKDSCGK